jgi:hypothetical protein
LMRVLVHPLGTTLQEDKKRVAVISFIWNSLTFVQ